MAISQFRRGSSTFECQVCKRLTRDTGTQSIGNHICPQCFELAGIENSISDGCTTVEQDRPYIDQLIAELVSKNVDVTMWKATFNL